MSMPAVPTPFLFNATPIDFHDGDTGTFTVDRGDRDFSTWTIRFAGCNARELAMPGGVEARDEVRRRVPPGTPCVLATVAPDKYGNRLDARIFYADPGGVVHDLVADLAADGWVALWDGTGKQPVPPWPRTAPPSAITTERSTMTDPTPSKATLKGTVADIGERALKTFAYTLAAYFGTGAFDVLHANWTSGLSLSAGATVLSVLGSVASLKLGNSGTASLTTAVAPVAPTDQYGKHASVEVQQEPTAEWMQEIRQPARKLGRLPNDPSKPRVRLTALEASPLTYDPPAAVDWYSKVPADSWGMDGNDRVGDCTCAEVDHGVKALEVAAGNSEVKSTPAEVLAGYSAITGYKPSDPNSDQGAVMQDVRNHWRKNGFRLGGQMHTILLFAEVDHTDHALVKWCIARFGEVGIGFNFPASAMQQFDAGQPWTVVAGSKIDGGHAVSAVGYDDQFVYVVTWGRVQKMAWAFFDKYVDETWTQLTEEFVSATSGNDPLAETAYQLGQQYAGVTGQPNPIPAPSPAPVPPSPAPVPVPVPGPDLPPAAVVAWAKHTLTLKGQSHGTLAVAHWILASAGVTS